MQRSRNVYQLLTDRFAVTSGNPPCSNLGDYCGGSFRGITEQLDYIQSMGFDAIWCVWCGYDGTNHGA